MRETAELSQGPANTRLQGGLGSGGPGSGIAGNRLGGQGKTCPGTGGLCGWRMGEGEGGKGRFQMA